MMTKLGFLPGFDAQGVLLGGFFNKAGKEPTPYALLAQQPRWRRCPGKMAYGPSIGHVSTIFQLIRSIPDCVHSD